MDAIEILIYWNRTALDKQFEALLNEYGKHEFVAANGEKVAFEDFYRAELPLGENYKEARAVLHNWHMQKATNINGVRWHLFDERAVVPLRTLQYSEDGMMELVNIRPPSLYHESEDKQKAAQRLAIKKILQAYELVTVPGQETWTLADGSTAAQAAIELESGVLSRKELGTLITLINNGGLQQPEEFEEGMS